MQEVCPPEFQLIVSETKAELQSRCRYYNESGSEEGGRKKPEQLLCRQETLAVYLPALSGRRETLIYIAHFKDNTITYALGLHLTKQLVNRKVFPEADHLILQLHVPRESVQ